MALMIPDYTTEFTTEGERRFFSFLANTAKPDRMFTSWYLPDLEGREPDFILYSDGVGLTIFEVKDWSLDQIEEADQHTFLLRAGGKTNRVKNPLRQAREYLTSLMDRMSKDGHLVSKDPRFFGKPILPIDCGVVFPNINKYQYCQRNLDQIIDAHRIFFQDDLHPASDICSDDSGKCFQKKLLEMFPPKFKFCITGAEYSRLKGILFPTIRVQPNHRNACLYIDPSKRVEVLDDKQEAVARRITPEMNIIKGVSGSGKTLVLVYRAAFLKISRPDAKILFLCYNITLVNYIKRLFSGIGVGLGPDGVQVFHFFEMCSRILGEEIQYENEGGDYYQLVIEETLSRLQTNPVKYDAVLIDEGQDFSAGMLKVTSRLLDQDNPFLTVALDEEQNIYGENVIGDLNRIVKKVRIDELPVSYRNTAEIRNFATRFVGGHGVSSTACEIRGPRPDLREVKGIEDAANFVSDTVRKLVDLREYPQSELAVLYARRISKPLGVSIPHLIMAKLESRGLVFNWVTESYGSKHFYDITTERVSVTTVHSAKGLDWACVFLLGFDEFVEDGWSVEQIKRLAYVAITRARHMLYIPYSAKNALIQALLSSL